MKKTGTCSIHEEFRETRLARGLTQKELASSLGIAQTTISAYERGALKIPSGLIDKIKEMIPSEIGTAVTGKELKALRMSRGLSIKVLAEALSLPYSTLLSYESGRTSVPRGLIERIQELFPEVPDQVAEEESENESYELSPGERLKVIRIIRGLSKTDLAKELHVSHVMIHYYESGKKKIPKGLIERIEKMFPLESEPADPGTELKMLRQSLGLTQIQLAETLGLTHSAVSHYETGRTQIPRGLFSKVIGLLK